MGQDRDDGKGREDPAEKEPDSQDQEALKAGEYADRAGKAEGLGPGPGVTHQERAREGEKHEKRPDEPNPSLMEKDSKTEKEEELRVTVETRVEKGPEAGDPPLFPGEKPVHCVKRTEDRKENPGEHGMAEPDGAADPPVGDEPEYAHPIGTEAEAAQKPCDWKEKRPGPAPAPATEGP